MRISCFVVIVSIVMIAGSAVAADDLIDEPTAVRQIEQLGGHVADGRPRQATVNYEPVPTMAIPFWAIVVPLVLLAAYLLLTKPRATKP